jgi:hypothetical protein
VSGKAGAGHASNAGESIHVPGLPRLFMHCHQSLRQSLVAQASQSSGLDEFSSHNVAQQEYQNILRQPIHGRLPSGRVSKRLFK